MDLSWFAWGILALTALLTGMSKTGIPGLGIVFVVLVPMALPAKVSTGYILPFLIFGDILAIICWRKSAVWRYVLAVMPAMLVGVIAGYFLMGRIDDAVYGKVLGVIVLFLMLVDWARRRFAIPVPVGSPAVGYLFGFLAGVMTMLANAAGAVTMIYLLAMSVSKEEFVGTAAWIFFIINLFKVPFSVALGLITWESLQVNLILLPFVLLGGYLGLVAIRRISGKSFDTLMRLLAFLGGLKLFFQ